VNGHETAPFFITNAAKKRYRVTQMISVICFTFDARGLTL